MGQLTDYFQHTLWSQKAERNRFEFRVRKDVSGGVVCLPLLEKNHMEVSSTASSRERQEFNFENGFEM